MSNTLRNFTVLDYPEKGKNFGIYKGKSPSIAAYKAFHKLCKKFSFVDNADGKFYLVFNLYDLEKKKVHPYIGTNVLLNNEVPIKKSNRTFKVNNRAIVSKFDSNMKKVFKPI